MSGEVDEPPAADPAALAVVGAAPQCARASLVVLLVANLVSVAGGAFSTIALPWFVLATTGSPALTGLAVLCDITPVVLLSFFAGAVVDRFGALTARLVSDALSAVTVLAIPLLHATTGLAYWQLLTLVALNGAARAPAPAASLVVLNHLVQASGASGTQVRSYYTAGIRLAFICGAPLAGLVITWRGAPAALILDAVTFALSAAVLLPLLRLPGLRRTSLAPAAAADPSTSTAPARRSTAWAGMSALASDKTLATMCALLLALAVINGGWGGALAPLYGQRVLGDPATLGLLFAASGAGAMVGNLAYPWIAARTNLTRLIWVCIALEGILGFGALAVVKTVSVLMVALFVAGLGLGLIGPLWLGLVVRSTSPNQQGHVFGVNFALEQAGVAVGAAGAGLLATHLDLTTLLISASVAGLVLTIAAATSPALRSLAHEEETTGLSAELHHPTTQQERST